MKKPRQYIVIDDDSTNNLICDFTIRAFDGQADIRLFTKPEEGLLAVKESEDQNDDPVPIVLFLDINMPTMSGWEFLEAFKELDERVKEQFTIFMLSSSIEDFGEKANQYPFVSGFYSKPLKMAYLEEIEKSRS